MYSPTTLPTQTPINGARASQALNTMAAWTIRRHGGFVVPSPMDDWKLSRLSTNAIGIRAKSEFTLSPPQSKMTAHEQDSAEGSARQAAASGRWPLPPPPR